MFERLDPPTPFEPDEAFRARAIARGSRIRRRRHRVVGGALGCVVVLAGAVGLAAGWSKQRYEDIQRVDVQGLPKHVDALSGAPFSVLVVGVDGPSPPGSGVVGERSDTMMVVRVDPAARKVRVLSLPRDLWVPIPGHGEGRLNSALPLGGATLLVSTVESSLGVPIDRYVQVDFDGFRRMVDGADVRVDVPYPVRAETSGLALDAGCQRLSGTQALSLVRSRRDLQWFYDGFWHRDVSGDLGRIARQQIFGRAVLAALGRASNPAGEALFLAGYADDLTLDTHWTRKQMEGLLDLAGELSAADVTTATIDARDAVVSGANVLFIGDDGPKALAWIRGERSEPGRSAPGTPAVLPNFSPC